MFFRHVGGLDLGRAIARSNFGRTRRKVAEAGRRRLDPAGVGHSGHEPGQIIPAQSTDAECAGPATFIGTAFPISAAATPPTLAPPGAAATGPAPASAPPTRPPRRPNPA